MTLPTMRSASTTLAAALLVALAPAARAGDEADTAVATGKHCFGEARPRWLATSMLVGAVTPRGLEEQLQLGRCLPLVTTPGALFDYTNLQYGLVAYLSPVYLQPGAYLSIAPLSVLELRAEVEYIWQWPIGLDAAGYFPLAARDTPWRKLPAANARSAQGYTASLTANLQAEFPLAAGWSLLAVNSSSYQPWKLGGAPYYYNARIDLSMARHDLLWRNMALLLLHHDLSSRVKVRFGLTDDFSWARGSGQGQNVVAALLAGVISGWPGPRSETQPFLRLGGYTAHPYRTGDLALLAGVGMTFDLSIRSRR